MLYVIKSPQSSMSIACDVIACGRYTRLRFWYSLYPCVLHAYFSFRDVPLALLCGMWVTWSLRAFHLLTDLTDVKCVLSQKAFDVFCEKFHIPEEVHPVLPNRGNTIHERLVGKIGLYTRFFDFANFRLPLSTFLADILRYFRINISQLSVIGAAKNVTRVPAPVVASIIMGPFVPSSSPRGRNEISVSGDKLCVTLYLATLCQGWTIRIAKALSFPDASPFFAAFGWSFPLLCFSSLITYNNFPALINSSIFDIGGSALNLPLSKAKISFGDFVRSANLKCFLSCLVGSRYFPLKNVVVSLIISSTDFGMLSCRRFISLGVLLRYLHFPRTLPFSVKTFLHGNAFWEWVPPFLNGDSDPHKSYQREEAGVGSGLILDGFNENVLDLFLLPCPLIMFGMFFDLDVCLYPLLGSSERFFLNILRR
ncbi:hypothetical protein Tco_0085606 [Tanacetum coccineum]